MAQKKPVWARPSPDGSHDHWFCSPASQTNLAGRSLSAACPDEALRLRRDRDHSPQFFEPSRLPATKPSRVVAACHAGCLGESEDCTAAVSFRKEVIQPQVPLRLPCYDLVPIAEFILGAWVLAVPSATSDAPHFRGLTGGVYKAQEHIHRGMLTRDY